MGWKILFLFWGSRLSLFPSLWLPLPEDPGGRAPEKKPAFSLEHMLFGAREHSSPFGGPSPSLSLSFPLPLFPSLRLPPGSRTTSRRSWWVGALPLLFLLGKYVLWGGVLVLLSPSIPPNVPLPSYCLTHLPTCSPHPTDPSHPPTHLPAHCPTRPLTRLPARPPTRRRTT